MKRNRKALVFWISLAVAVIGVGVVRAASPPKHEAPPAIQRIVPIAPPVDLSPCALASCW